jgi:hypothetical protein
MRVIVDLANTGDVSDELFKVIEKEFGDTCISVHPLQDDNEGQFADDEEVALKLIKFAQTVTEKFIDYETSQINVPQDKRAELIKQFTDLMDEEEDED